MFFGNFCLCGNCCIVGFFVCRRLRYFDIPFTFCPCNCCCFFNLYDVVNTKVFNYFITVNKILNVKADNIESHCCKIRFCVFLYKVCKFLAVRNHFLQLHLTHDFTNVAFQYFSGNSSNVFCIFVQKVFCSKTQPFRFITDFYVDCCIHIDINVVCCWYGVTCFDVNWYQTQIQFIQPFKKRDTKCCLSND